MLSALGIVVAIVLLAAAVALGWVLTVFSLPGNWVILAAAAIYAWLMPDDSRWDLSGRLIVVLAALAVVGEIVESVASAAGVRRLGGSRRGAVLSIVGSLVGAFVGTGLIPVPVIGTLVGAAVGAMFGAIAGELWKGNPDVRIEQIGWAAFWGRLFGSLAKVIVACIMAGVTLAGALF